LEKAASIATITYVFDNGQYERHLAMTISYNRIKISRMTKTSTVDTNKTIGKNTFNRTRFNCQKLKAMINS